MSSHDPRMTAAREDLAAESLRGTVEAPRYVSADEREVCVDAAPLLPSTSLNSSLASQLLFGERFAVYDSSKGLAWGQALQDGYVGYVPEKCLAAAGPGATHRVSARVTPMYRQPDAKARSTTSAWFESRLTGTGTVRNGFLELTNGSWVPEQLVAPVDGFDADHAGVAKRLMGAPYLYGGRTPAGLDCSALIQLSLAATGIFVPRDSDQQFSWAGPPLPVGETLQRGDIAFWRGHAGILLSKSRLLHANAHHMAVAAEPLDRAIDRIARSGHELLGICRVNDRM